MNLPLISITIAVKNEQNNIGRCLQSIKAQTYPQDKIETIVVDNNSTDKTKHIAQNYTKLVFNHGPERSAQRNFGMKQKSKGKYLLYLDGDMSLSATLLKNAVAWMEEKRLGGLYIPEKITGFGFWPKVRNFERSFYTGTAVDAVRMIKKDIFVKTGGFDENLTGPEDWDLDKRVRQMAVIGVLPKDKGVIRHHEGKFNFKKYRRKKNYYRKDFDKYIKKWGKSDPDIKKQFGPYYRLLGVFIENNKWRNLLKQPALAFGMYVLRINVGFWYVLAKLFK